MRDCFQKGFKLYFDFEAFLFVFLEMDHTVAVPCSNPPQPPENVGSFPFSDTSIFVSWDKPLGFGYKYTITVDGGGGTPKTASGEQGFGNAGFVQITGLSAKISYTVKVKLECTNNPNTFSGEISTQVTTLTTGEQTIKIPL